MWFVVVAILTILFIYRTWIRNKEIRWPRGPKGWPLVGNTFQINPSKFHFNLEEWAKEFGPIFKCNIMRTNMIVLSSPELIRKAFATDKYGRICNDRPDSFLQRYWLSESLLLMHYCETLFKARKTFHTGLHLYGDGVPKFENRVRGEIERLIERIRQTEGIDFDPGPILERSLGNLVSILAVGEPMSDDDAKIAWDFINVSNHVLNPTVEFFMYNFPFLRFIPGSKYKQFYKELLEKTDVVVDRYVRPYQRTYQPGVERGIIDAFIKIQKEEQEKGQAWFSDNQIISLMLSVIGGALITTISALLSIVLAIINNVPCEERIYEEIIRVVGKNRLPSLNDKTKMPYTEAVIMEALRLANVIPIIMPHNFLEECEFEGYKIPKDTRILANLWVVNRDPSIWGDPEVFRPERFLDADGNLLPPEHKLRQAWLLFGAGRRNCVGEVMARSRMFLYVASLIQAFRFLPPKQIRLVELNPRNFSSTISMRPPTYHCRAEERA